MIRNYSALLLAAWLGFCAPAQAVQPAQSLQSEQDVAAVHAMVPVPPALVERLVKDLLADWNTPFFAAALAPDFPNRERVLMSLAATPIDARLHLVGLGGVQTLEQERVDGVLVSLVRARARVVLQYSGHRSQSTVDLILRVRWEASRR